MGKFTLVYSIKVATDFVPETFGRLTTIGPKFMLPVGTQGHKASHQVCKCSCGETYCVVFTCSLVTGKTQSCGCFHSEQTSKSRTKHGKRNSATYRSRDAMIQRCTNPKDASYPDYGGRGIKVCPEWLNSQTGAKNFFDSMGERPSPAHEIERKDVNGDYCPENCCWVTRKEQARNKRNNHNLAYNGKTQCIAAWAEEIGINEKAIAGRLRRGWSVEKTLTVPARKGK